MGPRDIRRLGLIFLVLVWLPFSGEAALLGNNFQISGPGCRFPDVAYDTVNRQYLVVWTDYNVGRVFGRFVSDAGVPSGEVFPICDSAFGGLYPAVAFNATNAEFLVTWDDAGARGGVIYGQRVRGADGGLSGTNFAIGTLYGGIRSAVAWSPVNNVFLVVYWGNSGGFIDVFGQRVAGNGVLLGSNFNLSNDAPFSGYPAVSWGAANQFLVTWDHEDGNIHARRVDPASGTLLGPPITVTSGGAKDRSCIAYDSINGRWLVQFNNGANAGFSYDQHGQLVNLDGTLQGGIVPLAHSTAFEGDTQFGGDVAYVPGAARFFSSFGTDTGMGGQETFADTVNAVGNQVVIGTGYYTSLNNAADPRRNRFLTAWEGLVGNSFYVLGQLCSATINPISNFVGAAASGQVTMTWRNPRDSHFTGTLIRAGTNGYPTGPHDGSVVVDLAGAPDTQQSFTHTNLANWTTYYYAAFGHDIGDNYAVSAQAAATPRQPAVLVHVSDFDTGTDGWTLESWRAGSLSPGTVSRDVSAGNIASVGSGVSNNRDTCTREGTTMTRAISTAGRQSIQVEYDFAARLHAPATGGPNGACTVLDGSDEDKLLVLWSASGTNGPWNLAQVLNEGIELPADWTRKLVNLGGIAAVNNNPNFALRFQWQFNTANDTGRVDNIRVLSGAVTAPTPQLRLGGSILERTVQMGQNAPSGIVRVSNSGEGILGFSVSANVSWLNLLPASGSSAGPEQRVVVAFNSAGLPVGDYAAVVRATSGNVANSPQEVPVKLHVIPATCFREPFDYYDGHLTLMGGGNWSGTATNPIVVEDATLKIIGGEGIVSATRAVNCASSNSLIAAQIKIRKGAGSGDFFWNIGLDDAAGNNLARCYGGSSIARGRVGNSITPDMLLTGTGVWDDFYVKLDTAANTSEFFFNGASFGVISHGSTPANSVAAIRLERLDRASANGDTIFFDNLTVGAVDLTPPRLNFVRNGNMVRLSWPATGNGFSLQSSPGLTAPIVWTTMTNGFAVTNGEAVFSENIAGSNRFFQLRSF